MSQSYVSLNDFKGEGIANLTSDNFDSRLLAHLEAVSRQMDDYLGRWFYPKVQTRYPSISGGRQLALPDLDIISISSLKEDQDRDGIYETTWADSDYILAPYDNEPTSRTNPKPYWRIEVDRRAAGTKSRFGAGNVWWNQKRFEVTGKFGYCEMVQATGAVIAEGAEYSSSDTELTVDDGSKVHIGDTLVIESEYLYVTGQEVGSSNTFTVLRGANGSTAAAHADSTAISRLGYPKALVQAVVQQASRLWARRVGNFSQEIGFAEVGTLSPQVGFDLDVRQLLDQYKRYTIA